MATTIGDELTGQVVAAYAATPDGRSRELLESLTRHLHAFAVETGLTVAEWRAGVEFLTATAQKCDGGRQEFVLLSDILGLSSLVEAINAAGGATESTVLGPFYVPGAPERQAGQLPDPHGRPGWRLAPRLEAAPLAGGAHPCPFRLGIAERPGWVIMGRWQHTGAGSTLAVCGSPLGFGQARRVRESAARWPVPSSCA